ncbi:unannotated protein [freshwater metagenome]|uniref:Unannotated protein n=1 Tax=freshwater metagenome TaxID=449393 RepID=A0A6J6GZC1_9ZZZZ
MTVENSVVILSATESPMNNMEPTGASAVSDAAIGVASNQGAYRSKSPRNCHPVRVTTPALPVIRTEVAYPFQSPPRPSCVTAIDKNTPIEGYFFCISAAEKMRVHDCKIVSAAKSPLSTCAGNCPPAVRPPFEDVNSVRTMVRFESLIT